jgi:hypothetical protein
MKKRHKKHKQITQPSKPQRTNALNKYTNYPRVINTRGKKYSYLIYNINKKENWIETLGLATEMATSNIQNPEHNTKQ